MLSSLLGLWYVFLSTPIQISLLPLQRPKFCKWYPWKKVKFLEALGFQNLG